MSDKKDYSIGYRGDIYHELLDTCVEIKEYLNQRKSEDCIRILGKSRERILIIFEKIQEELYKEKFNKNLMEEIINEKK